MGVPLDALSVEDTLRRIEAFIDEGGAHEQVSLNAMKIVSLAKDPELRRLVRRSALISADGAGIIVGGRILGVPVPERVAGIDLFTRLMARAAERGWRPYLLGAKQEVLDAAAAHFLAKHPGLELAGTRNGYFKEDEEQGIAEAIRDSGADLLFIAISSPKKEQFLARWGPLMQVPYMQGVGGSFDVVAGKVSRAPRILRENHLEWAWRLALEPKRMWKRNVVGSSTYLSLVMQARLLGYRIPEDPEDPEALDASGGGHG